MIPRIDYPNITSPEHFLQHSKSLHLDRRKFITRSFTEEYDKIDALFMKRTGEKSLLDTESIRVINVLFNLLSTKGWRNIFFCTKEELCISLYGKEIPRNTLRYRLDQLRIKGILRIYDSKQGILNNQIKVCINPVYGFRWQNIYETFEEELTSSSFGTDRIKQETDKISPISSSFYSVMNNAKKRWNESLIPSELGTDRLVLQMCEAMKVEPTYIDTEESSRPAWIVNQKYQKGKLKEYLSTPIPPYHFI